MALLDGLARIQRLLNLEIQVAHVNHGLRANSVDDARFVSSYVETLGVRCHVIALPPKPAGENLERWAREQRYRVFARIVSEQSLDWVVTAHTANDVAETFLMRLVANKELNSIDEVDEVRRCLRPLLDVSRDQIDEHVKRHGIPFVEDPSNADTSFTRNRIRHELLPFLGEKFDPSIVWILAERARSVDADCEALRRNAQAIASRVGEVRCADAAWLEGCRRELVAVSPAVRWRGVQGLFAPIFGLTVGQSRAEALLGLLCGEARSLTFEDGVVVSVDENGVEVRGAG